MSLKVTLLVALVSQCWSAPYRRNWTPQAMLYLKGAQGQHSTLERRSREEDAYHIVNFNQISDGPGLSSVSVILLQLLQRAAEEGGGRPNNYQDWSLKNL
ncbi:spexin prohormone 1-like [Girardinichthys multiradiatus]|uniref:spexin prohormone 1-like n=1 Tax=Girardinichthys multiradiatus TaxID=208333 RepID=UPI001FABF69D|nr:spexin prohormone 1-like [Girardinichthys multiradiatus]XP_047208762.1 spexin prohormone 1-like [Girardinichthys multiradiatus]